jgi:aspartate ammonia-lyase
MEYRTEKDSLGEKQVPAEALYGIHSLRARENFPSDTLLPAEWYMAAGITKLACYNTYRNFINAARKKYGSSLPFKQIAGNVLDALCEAAADVSRGCYFSEFIVPSVQGGAGTSINMNVNEIIANASLLKLGRRPGSYEFIDPVEDANVFQSTNDVIPTALAVAAMKLLRELEEKINLLRQKTEEAEKEGRDMLRPGYTQMQEAVPSSFGLLFGAYNEALSRDWWRVSKCFERLKTVNLGGGATGTGMALPRFFIMEVVPELRRLTGLQITHGENLADATSNLDKWVEVHSILKAHAVNLEKIAGDIRLLASDISGKKLLKLPAKQVGSSIMPGKVNPVIAEFVISSSHKVYSNDQLVSSLCGQGCLELNAYLPVIGSAVIESLKLLAASDETLLVNLLSGTMVNYSAAYSEVLKSPSITTALIPHTGYNRAAELARLMKENNIDVFEANSILNVIDRSKLEMLLEPGNLLRLGYSLEDL